MTYPDLVESIRHEIQERINRSRLKKIKQGEHTEFSLNIYASKDRKKSSIKCLKDKLRYIQGWEYDTKKIFNVYKNSKY